MKRHTQRLLVMRNGLALPLPIPDNPPAGWLRSALRPGEVASIQARDGDTWRMVGELWLSASGRLLARGF